MIVLDDFSRRFCDARCLTLSDCLCRPTVAQILAMICLVALAFPQVDRLNGIPDDDSDNAPTSPAPPSTTTNCPCVATAEYNPICGTDNVTYWNRGRFNCAKNCNPSKTRRSFYCIAYFIASRYRPYTHSLRCVKKEKKLLLPSNRREFFARVTRVLKKKDK